MELQVGFVFLIVLLVLLFRPDPYKNQKVYAKRSRTECIRGTAGCFERHPAVFRKKG